MPTFPPPVQRVVDAASRKGVDLRIVTFDVSTHTAVAAAEAVGAEVGQIVKSLVFIAADEEAAQGYMALVSGANTVDVARLSAVLGEPRLRRATADEARALTGYAIGGIPPFGHHLPLPTVMDPDIGRFETVWAAAGLPNAVFEVAPATLRALANATVAPISREEPAASPHAAGESGGKPSAGAPVEA